MGVIERKEREKESRKNQILEAGERLFLKKGFENITMDEIAKECELSKGTLYLYYKSKEELFNTLVLKGMEILINMFRNGIESKDTLQDKMGQLGIQYLKFYKEHTNYFKLLNYMGDHKSMKNDGDAEVGKLLIQKNKEVWNLNVELFQEGINQGIFKNDFDPFEFAITLWAASNGIIMLLDHMKSQTQGASETELKEYPFCSINFEEILNRLWERLISSILADQSSEVKERYFKAEARS